MFFRHSRQNFPVALKERAVNRLIGLACVFLSLASLPGHAAMELNNVIFHFEPGEPVRQDVEVTNTGDQMLYVQIEPRRVLSPGEADESRNLYRDPREGGLMVTPNKLVVPPGATKVVRMVKMGSADTERVYRISAKPVVSDVVTDQSGLKILVGYDILAIVYPDAPEPQLAVERTGKQLTITNTGNTNVLLREGFQCAEPDLDRALCTAIPGRRMYPGNAWQVELPENLPVTYYQSVGTRNFMETYD